MRPRLPSSPEAFARVRPLSASVLGRMPRILVPLLALVGAPLYLTHERDLQQDYDLGGQRSLGNVELQAEIIEREVEWAAFTTQALAEDRLVREHLSGRDRRMELAHAFQRFCTLSGTFGQVRLLDHEGREVVRVDYDHGVASAVPESELQSKRSRYYFERTWELDRGGVYISPFDLNEEGGAVEVPWKPVIRVASLCFDSEGRKRGMVVLNYLGADLLERLERVGGAAPGWSALVNRDGYYLTAPAPAPSWGFLFGAEPTFASDHPNAWGRIARAAAGYFDGSGGLYTFRRIALEADTPDAPGETSVRSPGGLHRIDLGLHVVSFVPAERLYALSRRRLTRMLGAAAVLSLLLAAASWRLAYVGVVRERHEAHLSTSQEQLRRLSARLLDAQEEERRRLSRDLHDDLGQVATALTIDLGRAQRSEDPARKDESIRRAHDGAAQLLETVRRISASLRSTPVDDLGLEGALLALLADVHTRTGLHVEPLFEMGDTQLDSATSVHLYRIAQEALSNVIKHSEVERATLHLAVRGGMARLTVADEGVGFDPSASADGVGLLGMQERVELLGGRLQIATEEGRGTRIEACVPIEGGAGEALGEREGRAPQGDGTERGPA